MGTKGQRLFWMRRCDDDLHFPRVLRGLDRDDSRQTGLVDRRRRRTLVGRTWISVYPHRFHSLPIRLHDDGFPALRRLKAALRGNLAATDDRDLCASGALYALPQPVDEHNVAVLLLAKCPDCRGGHCRWKDERLRCSVPFGSQLPDHARFWRPGWPDILLLRHRFRDRELHQDGWPVGVLGSRLSRCLRLGRWTQAIPWPRHEYKGTSKGSHNEGFLRDSDSRRCPCRGQKARRTFDSDPGRRYRSPPPA